MTAALSVEQILALPAAVDLVTAGRALGIGRTKIHELARHGELPFEVLRVGSSYRVRRADLIGFLGLDATKGI
jgi:excisionase family DNA binding protein